MKAALGWEVKQAVVAPDPPKKLAVLAGGAAVDWSTDTVGGSYPGFWGEYSNATVYKADAERTLLALVAWLTGRASGASILVMNATGSAAAFGTEFQTTLATVHSVTVTNTMTGFAGYEPLDFDLLVWNSGWSGGTYHGVSTGNDVADYILDHFVPILSGTSKDWSRYGIVDSGAHGLWTGAPKVHAAYDQGPDVWWDQMPFLSTTLGSLASGGSWNTNKYAIGGYNGRRLTVGTNTKGGTLAIEDCACPNHASHSDPFQGVCALWSL